MVLMSLQFIYNKNHFHYKVLKGLAATVGVLALLLSLVNLLLGQYPLMVIEWMLIVACWHVYRRIAVNKLTYLESLIVPYLSVFAIIYGTSASKLVNGLFIWTFIVPTMFYLLYGKRHGFWATSLVGLIQVINILSKDNIELYNPKIVAINFAFAYFTLWVVSRAYEINRSKTQATLQELAMRDSLTGAYNRLALKQFFEQQQRQRSEQVLVLIDIDHFKSINDQYGHEAGDQVLIEFTALLHRQLDDSQVFRLGGEEFCLLLEVKGTRACQLTNDIKQLTGQTLFHYKNDRFHFSFSAGVTEHSSNHSLSEMLAEADKKLYQAKHNGRNQVVL